MCLLLSEKPKKDQENKSDGQIHTIYILPKCWKAGNVSLFEPILSIIAEADKEISNKVI